MGELLRKKSKQLKRLGARDQSGWNIRKKKLTRISTEKGLNLNL